MLLEVTGLRVEIPDRVLVRDLTFSLDAGSMLVVLGPNGSGKTLTLHTLAGLREPAAGQVSIMGRAHAAWPRRELARRLALLPQNIEDPFPATVLETVLLGRHPHISRWRWESGEDVAIAQAAIEAMGLGGYEKRDILTLSGGERRRAAIAAAFAQSPNIFLLDEPTNHLDPSHQIEALKLLRARADGGAAVIVTLHDANLAVRFADQALLLGTDGAWRYGPADQTLTAENLSQLYSTQFSSIEHEGRRLFFQN